MNRFLRVLLVSGILILTACAQVQERNLEYPLNIHTQLSGNFMVVRIFSSTDGQVKQGRIQVIDNGTQKVIVDEPLNKQGMVRFRPPTLANSLTITAVDNNGNKGMRLLGLNDIMPDRGRQL